MTGWIVALVLFCVLVAALVLGLFISAENLREGD